MHVLFPTYILLYISKLLMNERYIKYSKKNVCLMKELSGCTSGFIFQKCVVFWKKQKMTSNCYVATQDYCITHITYILCSRKF